MVVRKFNGYLYENTMDIKELPLFISSRLVKLLSSLSNPIAKDILNLVDSEQKFQNSYVDLNDDDMDSFTVLPVNRVSRLEGITEKDFTDPSENSIVWGKKFRQPMRIGSFVTRFLPKYAGQKDLENFVHQIKGKLDAENYELKMVRGEEIRKWYLVDTYYNPHPGIIDAPEEDGILDVRTPLMRSCLKQPEKQTFFDIYCDNPEQIGMLIMLDENKKLRARAVIWFDCFVVDKPGDPTKGVLMDRIYYTNESDVNIFIDYAKKNNWWYKPSQGKEIYTFVKDGQVCDKGVSTRIKNHGTFEKYPYIDTMCYYTPDTGRLSTNRGRPARNPSTGEIMERLQLHKANGGFKRLSKEK